MAGIQWRSVLFTRQISMGSFVLLFLVYLVSDVRVGCTKSSKYSQCQSHKHRDLTSWIDYLYMRVGNLQKKSDNLHQKTLEIDIIKDRVRRLDLCDPQMDDHIERKLQTLEEENLELKQNPNTGLNQQPSLKRNNQTSVWCYIWTYRDLWKRVEVLRRKTDVCVGSITKLEEANRRFEETIANLTKLINEKRSAFDVHNENGILNANDPNVDFRSEAADASDDFDIDGEDKYTTPCFGYYQFTIDMSGEQNATVALHINGKVVEDTKLRIASNDASASCNVIRRLDPNTKVDVHTTSNGIRAFVRFTGRLVFCEH